jgi:3-deoxy-7-phosphoheptulonate synthase
MRLSNVNIADGNSQKNHRNQPLVIDTICEQLVAGQKYITGVMIESHINEGRQNVPPEGPQSLKWGVSITDACVDWETTVTMLDKLNDVRHHLFLTSPSESYVAYRLLKKDARSS